MQPSSFLVNIAHQPEFLSAVSRSDIESRKNCATPKRLSSLDRFRHGGKEAWLVQW